MSVSSSIHPKQNRFLASLPDSDYAALYPDLEPITMPLGWNVFDATVPTGYVYFPVTSVLTMLHAKDAGLDAVMEVVFAGNESLIGISACIKGENSLRHGVVHTAGEGYRVKAAVAKSAFVRGGGFQQLALRYAKSTNAQLAHIAACRRKHCPLMQLSRWLLLCSDVSGVAELKMTRDLINHMLHRDGMAQAVETLELAGAIHYARGHISILDRIKLQQYACVCYGGVKSARAAYLSDSDVSIQASGPMDASDRPLR